MSVRHGESEQADRFISIVHLLDEALGLGQNGLHRYEHVGAGGAAGDLAEVVELHFQREGVAAKLLFLESADKFFCHMVEFYDQGHYLNKLQFYVGEDGKARIGLEKTEILANDYEVVGAWNLYYLGDLGEDYIETAIEGVESATEAEVVSTTIYSLNGTVLSAPQKGINILRSVLSDGSVKVQKVLVR